GTPPAVHERDVVEQEVWQGNAHDRASNRELVPAVDVQERPEGEYEVDDRHHSEEARLVSRRAQRSEEGEGQQRVPEIDGLLIGIPGKSLVDRPDEPTEQGIPRARREEREEIGGIDTGFRQLKGHDGVPGAASIESATN